MVKCYLNLSIFTVFLKNKNIIFKIRRSKVTDYAALKFVDTCHMQRSGDCCCCLVMIYVVYSCFCENMFLKIERQTIKKKTELYF